MLPIILTLFILGNLYCLCLVRMTARPMPKQQIKEQSHDHPHHETYSHGAIDSDPAQGPPPIHIHHNSAGVVQVSDALQGHKPGHAVRTINPIAQTAYASLDRSLKANVAGEILGFGPAWACEEYAGPDHNYYDCPACKGNFADRMKANSKGEK